ncbi:flagellar hook-length control protein FliK [Nitrospina gracilis]|uniref:flagellar hook-length control protein FliK n=1 Tax=Nitrospina TaxID=35800 RepID=UPI001183C010|nr:flagellar hook-length control protein FliK [Nitrospina gracilis]MCF8723031.1 flagellar hook-length control protein FliK [Nitrospina sp. Nb-3]
MNTQNKNILAQLIGPGPQSRQSGFQPGIKEAGAPDFDKFMQNDTRTVRRDSVSSSDAHHHDRRFDDTRTESHNRTREFVHEPKTESRFSKTKHSRTHDSKYRTTASDNRETQWADGKQARPVPQETSLQALLALLQNSGGLSPEAEALLASAENSSKPGTDALMQLLNQLKTDPDLQLMNLISGQNGGASKDMLIEQLRQMDLDPEVLDRLIAALNDDMNQNGQGGAFLMALNGLLQALQNLQVENPEDGMAVQSAQNNGANASVLEKKVIDALMKAGLTEAEARKIIEEARGMNSSDSKVDGRIVLAKLAQSISKSKGAGQPTPDTQTEPAPPSRESKLNLDTRSTDAKMKTPAELMGEKSGSQTVSNLTHEGKAHTNPGMQPLNPNAAAPKPAAVSAQAATATAVNGLNTGGEATQTANQTAPVGATSTSPVSDKAGEGFRPMMAETYSARGGVEKPVTAQIIEKVAFRNLGHSREVHIKLDPPSLGTVRLNVSSSGETVRATLVAENHAVKQAIEGSLTQLRDTMHSQGVKVDSFTVLVGGNHHGQSPHQRQEQVHAFRPFDPAQGPDTSGPVEEVAFTRPVFFNESQTISLFA